MAGKFTKSWSFFGPRRPQSEDYLGQHYQPGTPSSRINLQQRFGETKHQNRGWRKGPLPPPPTQTNNGQSSHQQDCYGVRQIPRFSSFDFNRLGDVPSHYQYENIDNFHATSNSGACSSKSPRASTLPRRPLRNIPSGIAPILNSMQDNMQQFKPQTNKFWQEGGRKVNRAIQGVRTSLSSFTQLFRSTTRRRYKLDGTPNHTPRRTPTRPQRQTPGKLYSPFNINTPKTPYSHNRPPKRLQSATPRRIIYGSENRAMTRTPQHPSRAPPDSFQWTQFHSPTQNFNRDVSAMSQGLGEFHRVGNGIISNASGRWTQFR